MRVTFTLLFLMAPIQSIWAESVTIRFFDETANSPIPVRVELIDSDNEAFFAENAIPITGECALAPLPSWLSQPPPVSIDNPYTGTQQHYVNGTGRYKLEPGRYKLRAFRGSEYRITKREFSVTDKPLTLDVELSRWTEQDSDSWISVDAHLHIARSSSAQNKNISLWMAAEGLQIANLLQMGAPTHFAASPQYDFGEEGTYYHRGTMLISGQEHPRTHIFGHAISLGGSIPVDERRNYLLYDSTFKQVKQTGGISGFAHWGTGPSGDGLALNVPFGNVELLEVLSFEFLHLDAWYQLLSLGFPIAAAAGTDFPCLPGIPGRERTYIQVSGSLTRQGMVQAFRAGRTIVTNGPMLNLSIDGHGIGSRIVSYAGQPLSVKGKVRFDPAQDELDSLELILNGEVIKSWSTDASGKFEFQEDITLDAPGWLALRTSGQKLGETKPPANTFPAWISLAFSKWMSGGNSRETDIFFKTRKNRQSYAHTSPIYVSLHNSANNWPNGNASEWIARLDRIEKMLLDEEFEDVRIWDWIPYSDGVSAEHIKENTTELILQIRKARVEFLQRATSQ